MNRIGMPDRVSKTILFCFSLLLGWLLLTQCIVFETVCASNEDCAQFADTVCFAGRCVYCKGGTACETRDASAYPKPERSPDSPGRDKSLSQEIKHSTSEPTVPEKNVPLEHGPVPETIKGNPLIGGILLVGRSDSSIVVNEILLGPGGELYIAGNFEKKLAFPDKEATVTFTGAHMFIAKIDSKGKTEWIYTGRFPSFANGMTLTNDGRLVVVGALFKQGVPREIAFLSLNASDGGSVARAVTGCSLRCEGVDVAVGSDGKTLYVTGYTSGFTDFRLNGTKLPYQGSSEKTMFVGRVNSGNNFNWLRFFTGSKTVRPRKIAVDSKEQVYVVGTFTGTFATPAAQTSKTNLTTVGLADIFMTVLKGDIQKPTTPNVIKAIQIGSVGGDEALGLKIHDGKPLIAGYLSAKLSSKSEYTSKASKGSQFFLGKFDFQGKCAWLEQGVAGVVDARSKGTGIASTLNGGVLAVGTYNHLLDFRGQRVKVSQSAPAKHNLLLYSTNTDNTSFGVFGYGDEAEVKDAHIAIRKGSMVIVGSFSGILDFEGKKESANQGIFIWRGKAP